MPVSTIKLGEPPPRKPRPSRGEVRERLISSAREVFTAKGYDASSVDDIARHAGLTKGAVYSNFKSKDELFFALLGETVAARIAVVEEIPSTPKPREEWARESGVILTRTMMEDPGWHILFIEFWQRAMRDPDSRRKFVPYRRQLRKLVAGAIDHRASELGVELHAPAEELATIVLALSNGLAIEYLLDPESVPEGLLGDALVSILS